MKWACVIPSNRPDQLALFLEAWDELFKKHDVQIVVVEDSPEGWKDIPEFIPRQTDMIRSWGMYKAYQLNTDYILTLDDDTRPQGDIFEEYEKEFEEGRPVGTYFSVGSLTDSGLEMRGYPYRDRKLLPVGVQYGGWNGVMDFDAATQLAVPKPEGKFIPINIAVPHNVPVTCCIMNTAWRRELTPIMWQLPMLDGLYNRFGDIWSGLFIKKALDNMGYALVINGRASIKHARASNPFNNMRREAPGLEINESLWDNLVDGDYTEVTDSAIEYFERFNERYAAHFKYCRDEWSKLWI